jgi:Mg-chelatase subunit ChlD
MASGAFLDLKQAVGVFLQTLQANQTEERVGLVSYAEAVYYHHGLTTDLDAIQNTMDALWTVRARTNIGGGMDMGRNILNNASSSGLTEKVIILMTDGYHNTGTDPIMAAARAQADGVIVHTVTFGWYADQILMQAIANSTGGEFRHAPDGATLVEVFRELAMIRRVVLTK